MFTAFFDYIYQGCRYIGHDCMYVYIYIHSWSQKFIYKYLDYFTK